MVFLCLLNLASKENYFDKGKQNLKKKKKHNQVLLLQFLFMNCQTFNSRSNSQPNFAF